MIARRWLALITITGIIALLEASPLLGESGGRASPAAPFGYTLTNEGGVRFADEYQRLGGVVRLHNPA